MKTTTSEQAIEQLHEQLVAEQATGCRGAGDYRRYAESQGYPHVAVIDWTSSAGDWSFLVSKDGMEWQLMFQSNNYPRGGFTRTIQEEPKFYGTEEEALTEACSFYG